jgi:hypothetical protein
MDVEYMLLAKSENFIIFGDLDITYIDLDYNGNTTP